MGTMLAQLAVGLVLSKVAQKWGSKAKPVPQVTGKDIVPATQAETPEFAQLGSETPNYVRKNREALTIKQNTNNDYNPMNMQNTKGEPWEDLRNSLV